MIRAASTLAALLLLLVPASSAAHRQHGRRHRRVSHHHRHRVRNAHAHRSAQPHRPGAPRFAGVSASGVCQGADLQPDARNVTAVEQATLCLINDERARHGERPLTDNRRLALAAASHSRDMVARDYFDHVSPGGQTPLDRIRASGFLPRRPISFQIGENIAWGTLYLATPRETVRAWMASPGHRANILDRRYRYTGVGIDPAVPASFAQGQAGAIYTQDFAALG